jgi:hypothetical protein
MGFAAAALISGLVALYVAMRVPWVENLPALLPNPPQVVAAKQPMPISTAVYLFTLPLALAVFGAMLADPWGAQLVRFRGSRESSLRALPAIGLIAAAYSVWHSFGALAAAMP